jgi:hypothetical protein
MKVEEIRSLRDHMYEVWAKLQLMLDTDHDMDPDLEIRAVKLRNALSVADNAASKVQEEL